MNDLIDRLRELSSLIYGKDGATMCLDAAIDTAMRGEGE